MSILQNIRKFKLRKRKKNAPKVNQVVMDRARIWTYIGSKHWVTWSKMLQGKGSLWNLGEGSR